MKKVAIIAKTLIGGGIESFSVSLSHILKDVGYEVHIILFTNIYNKNELKGITVHSLSNDGKITKISQIRPYIFASKIKEIKNKYNFDIVFSNLADFEGMKIVDLSNFQNIYTIVHSTQSKRRFLRHKEKGFSLFKEFKKYKIRKSFLDKKLICVSEGVQNDLLENLKIEPFSITNIYNPFNFNKIKEMSMEECSIIPNDDYIIHASRFIMQYKRHDILLKAYKKSNIKEKLVLLGEGKDKKKIISLIKELELEEKVIMPGFFNNPFPWIRKAKLFILSSDYEGFGNVLVESLVLNTPVVSTNCTSGPSEILTGSLSNFLVPPGNIELLSQKIKEALLSYPLIDKDNLNKFEDKYIVKQYEELINE